MSYIVRITKENGLVEYVCENNGRASKTNPERMKAYKFHYKGDARLLASQFHNGYVELV